MKLSPNKKRFLKIAGLILGFLTIVLVSFHYWFVNNAEKIIEDLVYAKSNGNLRLKVENMKFNYFSKKIELENVVFYSNDTTNEYTSYRFSVDHIFLRAKAILPIVFRKELLIDSLFLSGPNVVVTRLKVNDKIKTKQTKDVSVPEEMGRIYNSIQDAINILQVDRFEFDKGKFTLLNKIDPDSKPFEISNLHFYIDNLDFDSTTRHEKVLFSDQIFLETYDQDILFPDGNHRLAFSKFRINVKNQHIEFDSCTISGKKSDSSRSNFSVFFDTLRLVNLDFKSLYQSELIKADSVYCLNPKFSINLESKVRSERKDIPNIDTLVQDFTGDMQLGYVGVINADIDITTYKNDAPSTFSSRGNTFEMRGLVIDHHLTRPVSVQGFAMAIRDYENFFNDSTYSLRFDSIHIRENRIVLSNFSVKSGKGKPVRTVNVSQFELDGLSWSHLLFSKTLKAREAVLYNPTIVYTAGARKARKNQNVFQSLGELNDIMELDKLRIINGNIQMNLSNNVRLDLENAYLFVKSQVLLDSKKYRNIEQSVEELKFKKALLRIKGLLVELQDANFTGVSNQLSIKFARAYSGRQTINANARDILLDEIQFDEENNIVNTQGLSWQRAKVEINSNPKLKRPGGNDIGVNIRDIDVNNTSLVYNGKDITVDAFLEKVTTKEISKASEMRINGVAARGNHLSINGKEINGTVESFNLVDNANSTLSTVLFRKQSVGDSILLFTPKINLIPDLNSLLDGKNKFGLLYLLQPELSISKRKTASPSNSNSKFPVLSVAKLEIDQPNFNIENTVNDSSSHFEWKGKNNSIVINDLVSTGDEIRIGKLNGDLSGLLSQDRKGKTISSRDGKFKASLSNIHIKNGDSLNWSMHLVQADMADFHIDSMGKSKATLQINSAKAANITLSSDNLRDLALLLRNNPGMSFSNTNGSYLSKMDDLRWFNFSFNNSNNTGSLDSITYHPVPTRDEFIAMFPYQKDYMTLRTGKITMQQLDLDRYLADSSVRMHVLSIESPKFTTYRDKRLPFRSGIYKPLATKLIQKIPFPVSIDTIRINDGSVYYAELNDKTKEEGAIPVMRMSGDIFPIKNFNIKPTDSLRIRINGYLFDSAWVRLRVRESYMDSLSGFILTVRMRPGRLTYLNPALAPLASVRLKTGYLDTLVMRAVGRDDLSLGEMRMYYHDLRVEFLKSGKETKKGLVSGLMTFIANSFVIRKQNDKRAGTVYFPRNQDRSFINYYIKMIMSGVATSVGAKKNRKMLRKYSRELDKSNLPPIDF